ITTSPKPTSMIPRPKSARVAVAEPVRARGAAGVPVVAVPGTEGAPAGAAVVAPGVDWAARFGPATDAPAGPRVTDGADFGATGAGAVVPGAGAAASAGWP